MTDVIKMKLRCYEINFPTAALQTQKNVSNLRV